MGFRQNWRGRTGLTGDMDRTSTPSLLRSNTDGLMAHRAVWHCRDANFLALRPSCTDIHREADVSGAAAGNDDQFRRLAGARMLSMRRLGRAYLRGCTRL